MIARQSGTSRLSLPPKPWPRRTVVTRTAADERVTADGFSYLLSCGHLVYSSRATVGGRMECPTCGYFAQEVEG